MADFENRLKEIFNEVDDYLEDRYGSLYPLHPARAERGKTSSKSHDGLFTVSSSFTAGIGSEKGKGYSVSIRFVTLQKVDRELQRQIENEVIELINRKLDEKFPERELEVTRDKSGIKIYGDLSLGSL